MHVVISLRWCKRGKSNSWLRSCDHKLYQGFLHPLKRLCHQISSLILSYEYSCVRRNLTDEWWFPTCGWSSWCNEKICTKFEIHEKSGKAWNYYLQIYNYMQRDMHDYNCYYKKKSNPPRAKVHSKTSTLFMWYFTFIHELNHNTIIAQCEKHCFVEKVRLDRTYSRMVCPPPPSPHLVT